MAALASSVSAPLGLASLGPVVLGQALMERGLTLAAAPAGTRAPAMSRGRAT